MSVETLSTFAQLRRMQIYRLRGCENCCAYVSNNSLPSIRLLVCAVVYHIVEITERRVESCVLVLSNQVLVTLTDIFTCVRHRLAESTCDGVMF